MFEDIRRIVMMLLFLIVILVVWIVQDWKKKFLMEDVDKSDMPFVLLTRIGLIGLFVFLIVMVRIVWHRRSAKAEEIEG